METLYSLLNNNNNNNNKRLSGSRPEQSVADVFVYST